MKYVFHKTYGIGTANEPYLKYGQYQIDVSFDSDTLTFLYPLVFDKGILTEIKSPSTDETKSATPLDRVAIEILLGEYIDDFITKKNYPFVVKNSIPVVWFGDIDSYEKSKKRILTIGLNPSKEEFPQNVASRFEIIDFEKQPKSVQILTNTLNNYFRHNPYKRWFLKYNKLLNAIDSSYGGVMGKKENSAIHIDIYSAIATDPTWGYLSDTQKRLLQKSELFDRLLALLNPDIILISVNRQIFNNHFLNWKYISEERFPGNNYIKFYQKNTKKLILGTNFQGIPFGGIKEEFAINTIKNLTYR